MVHVTHSDTNALRPRDLRSEKELEDGIEERQVKCLYGEQAPDGEDLRGYGSEGVSSLVKVLEPDEGRQGNTK